MSLRELSLYLSRKKGDYKSGLLSYADLRADDRMLFIYGQKAMEDLEFLHGLVQKGFNSDSSAQLYCEAGKQNELKKMLDSYSIRFVIVFDSEILTDDQKYMLASQSAPVVYADKIEKIRNDQSIKKSFWNTVREL